MKNWSKKWVSSKKPGKQRKYTHKAPLHVRRTLMSGHLSAELRKKYARRGFPLRIGDKVKIMRGQFRNHIGEVEKIDRKNYKIYIKGAEVKKKEGTKTNKPLAPSNVKIITLNLEDKKRVLALERTMRKK